MHGTQIIPFGMVMMKDSGLKFTLNDKFREFVGL
jgi:hypothetical protein